MKIGLSLFGKRGQSLLEYTMLVGVITIAVYYMGTMLKRSVQSVIKVTADQIGSQKDADQDFNSDTGYVDSSRTLTGSNIVRQTIEDVNYYRKNTMVEHTTAATNTITNLGYTQE